MPTSLEVSKNLLVRDWMVSCSRKQAFQGPPRITQIIAARQSSMAKILFKNLKVLLAVELGL
jgi:hypothetical protein